jgi:transcriptional regulator
MYRPPAFREDRLEVLHGLIRAHPLAQLVTAGAGGLMANPVPCLVDGEAVPNGMLRLHLAKANPQVDELRSGAQALAIFQGPQAYVSPSWYPGKAEHGKVVPTWNYVTVHAWGTPRVMDAAALRRQIEDLTMSQEQGRPSPWAVGDAPEDFIATMINAIVGIEIPIGRIESKWKLSQNRSEADRRGVAEGLRAAGSQAMAGLVERAV